MSLMVGSARIDENGKISGGKPGDQTGNEVSTQPYYVHSKGWICMRAKSVPVANAIAKAMLQACENDNIGYCQGHRTTVIGQLRKSGSLAKISAKTEADCSSLVRACCIQAGFAPGNFNTSAEVSALKASKQFTEPITVTSGTKLYNGDILVTKTKGHTVVVVSGNPRQAVSYYPLSTKEHRVPLLRHLQRLERKIHPRLIVRRLQPQMVSRITHTLRRRTLRW